MTEGGQEMTGKGTGRAYPLPGAPAAALGGAAGSKSLASVTAAPTAAREERAEDAWEGSARVSA